MSTRSWRGSIAKRRLFATKIGDRGWEGIASLFRSTPMYLQTADAAASEPSAVIDVVATAREAGLRYVNDHMAGIRRKRAGRSFSYIDKAGEKVADPKTLARIRKPWRSRRPGRKCGSAHRPTGICRRPDWMLAAASNIAITRNGGRSATKRNITGWSPSAAPYRLRSATGSGVTLARDGLPREKILAAIVRLLETTLIRIGTYRREYARENASVRPDHPAQQTYRGRRQHRAFRVPRQKRQDAHAGTERPQAGGHRQTLPFLRIAGIRAVSICRPRRPAAQRRFR